MDEEFIRYDKVCGEVVLLKEELERQNDITKVMTRNFQDVIRDKETEIAQLRSVVNQLKLQTEGSVSKRPQLCQVRWAADVEVMESGKKYRKMKEKLGKLRKKFAALEAGAEM